MTLWMESGSHRVLIPRNCSQSRSLQVLKKLAPQVGFEPTTLRLTAKRRCLDSWVLRAGSSDESLLIQRVRQRIVQRLCSQYAASSQRVAALFRDHDGFSGRMQ